MQGCHLSITHRFLLCSFLTLTHICIFQNMCTSPEPLYRKGLSYRPYSPSAMTKAYYSVTDNGISIRGTAYTFGLPEAALRNRVSGKVGVEVIKSGREPLLNQPNFFEFNPSVVNKSLLKQVEVLKRSDKERKSRCHSGRWYNPR